MSTALRAPTKMRRPDHLLCVVQHIPQSRIGACFLPAGTEGKHEHHGRTSVPGPFIATRFPLASLRTSMATFRGHPRRGAVVRLDGYADLGRVGLDRSDDVRAPQTDSFADGHRLRRDLSRRCSCQHARQTQSPLLRSKAPAPIATEPSASLRHRHLFPNVLRRHPRLLPPSPSALRLVVILHPHP